MIQIRRIHNTNSRTQRATLTTHRRHALPSRNCLPADQFPQPEPSMLSHGIEYPALFGQVGSARLAVFPPGFR